MACQDPEKQPWLDRWHRRGELLFIAGLTSTITAASVGEWLPAVIAGGVIISGLYLIVAAESSWWIPGRKAFLAGSRARSLAAPVEGIVPSRDADELTHALDRINASLAMIAQRLAERRTDEP